MKTQKTISSYLKNTFRITILFVSLFSASGIGYSQNTNESSKNLVRAIMEELINTPNTPPGISVAIGHENEIIFSEGYGYANLKTKERVTPNTQFRAASVSKIVTVTALAKLMESGKLNFEDYVHKYVPEYSKKKYSFTIKQLAGHLAGIPHYSDADNLEEQRHYKSVKEALGVFSHIELLNKPGDKYNYSTHAYTLLSRVIEEASNQNFINYLNEKILDPLLMQSTGLDLRSSPPAEMTELYGFHRNGINKGLPTKLNNPEDPSYKWAGGGLISTPSDLVKMANSYLYGFIKKDVVNEMFKTQKLNSGEDTGVGIGWRQNWDMSDRKVYEHAGAMGGTRTVVCIFPDENLTLSIMGNAQRLRVIEETAHMLALPFLMSSSPIVQPIGVSNIDFTINSSKKPLNKKGKLILDGENDRLIVDQGTENEKTYKLIYMQRKNIYALIHSHGILYTEIESDNGLISGKTMYYNSANVSKPSQGLPVFEFNGAFENEN